MRWKPHNYQKTALSFLLSNPTRGLFLDPGLGKTSTSLAAIKILKQAEQTKGVLLIAPLRVIYSVWPGEIKQWDNFKGLSYTILHGKSKSTLWGDQKDIYLINPEGLNWLYKELSTNLNNGMPCPFDTLWVDESTKFKNHESSRFKLLCDMLPLFKRRHIMTGTPVPKNYLNIWPQIYLLDKGKTLGNNFYHFRNRYFESPDWNKHQYNLKPGAAKQIQKAIAHLVLNMSASDHLNLPDITYNNINVELPKKALKQYKTMESKLFAELENDDINATNAASSNIKCHQIANGNVYEDIPEDLDKASLQEFKKHRKTYHLHDAKIEALKDLVDELNGKPLLIAYYYKHDILSIKKALGDVPYIGSGVAPKEQHKIEKDWNNGNISILLGHPASMAFGLNLQKGGNDICWYSMTWDLEDYLQFNARIYRQGVSGSCRVHHIIASNTIDEAMLLRLTNKKEGQEGLRKALEQYRRNLL